MNAITKITTADPFERPQDRAYRASVSIHYPNIDDVEMATRVDIMAMRDQAYAAQRKCCDDALPILAECHRTGSLAALSGRDTRRLVQVRMAMWMMIEAARCMERGK